MNFELKTRNISYLTGLLHLEVQYCFKRSDFNCWVLDGIKIIYYSSFGFYVNHQRVIQYDLWIYRIREYLKYLNKLPIKYFNILIFLQAWSLILRKCALKLVFFLISPLETLFYLGLGGHSSLWWCLINKL